MWQPAVMILLVIPTLISSTKRGWNLIADASNQPYSTKILARSAASGATLNNLKIGKDAGGTVNDFGGDIGEILIFDRQLTSTEEAKIVDHLVHKWGDTCFSKFPALKYIQPATLAGCIGNIKHYQE